MKQIQSFLLALLTLTLLLSACGTASPAPAATPEAPAAPSAAPASDAPGDPPATTPPEEAAPLPAQVTAGRVSLALPEGWVYEERAEDTQGWTLAFGPAEDTRRVLLRDYSGGFGVCGTGLTETELLLQSGGTARVGFYDGGGCWCFVSFGNGWAALNDQFPEWSGQALEVLSTVLFTDR